MTVVKPVKRLAKRVGIRRRRIAALRMKAERSLLALRSSSKQRNTGRILCYHGVDTEQWGVNSVSSAQFREHIEFALQLGYHFVPARLIASGNSTARDLAITFDDGLLSVATNAAPILAEYGVPWSVFVVADWADGRHGFGDRVIMGWTEVERLATQGVEIGSHSMSHPNFGLLSAAEAHRELLDSRRLIQDRIGLDTDTFAIPFGRAANWSRHAQTAASAAGYEVVYANCMSRRPARTTPRTMISRFDHKHLLKAALTGAFDDWQEWI